MEKIAFVFPGQGAQKVGMGKDAFESHDGARQLFEKADDVLGFQLTKIIFDGPDEELKATYNTQPALLTVSLAFYEIFKDAGLKPDFMAGHSLGEYTALVAAGVLSFEEAVRLVHLRGKFMEEAVPQGEGAMAAVLGADRDQLEKLCKQISEEKALVEPANVNSPGQIVVSGSAAGVKEVSQRAKEAGARGVIPLEVSGPFHSSLMRPAAARLSGELAAASLQRASVPVVANVNARPVEDGAEIRQLLERQVYSPVLWEDSVNWMLEEGVDTFVEIGPGSVLAGLIKKINRKVEIISVNSLEAALELNK